MDQFLFCAYANRRIFPGVGILIGASDEEEAFWGNWQTGQSMSAHYSAHSERLSFGIKFKLIKAGKFAAKAHDNIESLETAWICSWRDVPAHVPCRKQLNEEAVSKARSISALIPTD